MIQFPSQTTMQRHCLLLNPRVRIPSDKHRERATIKPQANERCLPSPVLAQPTTTSPAEEITPLLPLPCLPSFQTSIAVKVGVIPKSRGPWLRLSRAAEPRPEHAW
ncbi:hypothetical protein BKA80DRAFT_281605 [Phyllosticta citrichinensis]